MTHLIPSPILSRLPVWCAGAALILFATAWTARAYDIKVETGDARRVYASPPYESPNIEGSNPAQGFFTGFVQNPNYSKAVAVFNTVGTQGLAGIDFQSLTITLRVEGIHNVAPNDNLLTSARAIVFIAGSDKVTTGMYGDDVQELARFENVLTPDSKSRVVRLQSPELDAAVAKHFSRITEDEYLGVRVELMTTPEPGSAADNKTVHFYNFFPMNAGPELRPVAVFTTK